MIYCHYI